MNAKFQNLLFELFAFYSFHSLIIRIICALFEVFVIKIPSRS